jgi:hypothetical protein
MYFAHISAALVAKPAVPKVSLGVLLVASLAIDILSGVFMIIGIEYTSSDGVPYFPWSHGLLMASVFTVVVFLGALLATRNRRSSIAIGLVYFSHWVLDFIAHPMGFGAPMEPDLPLAFANSPRVGLGLYNYVVPALVTEFAVFAGGIVYYLVKSRSIDTTGKWAFWVVPVAMVIIIIPLTISPDLAAVSTILAVVLLPIGIWVDRHRTVALPAAVA